MADKQERSGGGEGCTGSQNHGQYGGRGGGRGGQQRRGGNRGGQQGRGYQGGYHTKDGGNSGGQLGRSGHGDLSGRGNGNQGKEGRPGSGRGYESSSTSSSESYGSGSGARFQPRGRGSGRGRSSVTTFLDIALSSESEPIVEEGMTDLVWKDLAEEKDKIQLPVVTARSSIQTCIAKQISVTGNHILANIDFSKVGSIYPYEIKIARVIRNESKTRVMTIEKLPRGIRIKVLRNARDQFEKLYKQHSKSPVCIVTDFSVQIYATQRLELVDALTVDVLESELEDEIGDGTFRVTLTPVEGEIRASDFGIVNDLFNGIIEKSVAEQAAIMNKLVILSKAYNTMLKCLGDGGYLPVGRSLIKFPSGDGHYLGGGLVNWTGASVIYNFGWKPYINVDIANSTFLLGKNVLEVLAQLLDKLDHDVADVTRWTYDDVKKASKFLFGCKVRKQISMSQIQDGGVSGLERRSVSQVRFEFNGKMVSVFDYYRTQYNLNLRFKNGPCLIMGNKKTFVPAELCVIKKGKSFNGKLSDVQTSKMIDIARKEPAQLEQAIHSVIKDLGMKSNPAMKAFGVSFEGNLVEINNAKVLKSPNLVYGYAEGKKGRAVLTPEPGKWDIWGNQAFDFYKPQKVNVWGIVVVGCKCYDDELVGFEQVLVRLAQTRGMQMPSASFAQNLFLKERDVHANNVNKLMEKFRELKSQFMLDNRSFVVVIIPGKTSIIYKQVKQAAELYEAVLTQCVLKNNIHQGPRQESVVGNLVLKINAKLGGISHIPVAPTEEIKSVLKKIDILSYPCMIMGIDVTHPPPGLEKGEQKVCSFAAVTGTIGRSAMPYMMHSHAQEKAARGAAEIVQGLDKIMEKMIKAFEYFSGFKPVKLIIYRDGVGDGQFKEVLHYEMRDIRQACFNIGGPEYRPQITFLTVQKRHKTRFFFHDARNGTVNAPPGSLVDTEIVHPTELDFYLQSHAAIKGTARPTRYHMLWDDSSFTPDQIYMLTYYLCFMDSRCNRSVKIPAPTYYAHWAAARAKALTEGLQFSTLDQMNKHLSYREAGTSKGGPSFATMFPTHFI